MKKYIYTTIVASLIPWVLFSVFSGQISDWPAEITKLAIAMTIMMFLFVGGFSWAFYRDELRYNKKKKITREFEESGEKDECLKIIREGLMTKDKSELVDRIFRLSGVATSMPIGEIRNIAEEYRKVKKEKGG
jgi:hypothetical protein